MRVATVFAWVEMQGLIIEGVSVIPRTEYRSPKVVAIGAAQNGYDVSIKVVAPRGLKLVDAFRRGEVACECSEPRNPETIVLRRHNFKQLPTSLRSFRHFVELVEQFRVMVSNVARQPLAENCENRILRQ